jgi:hypothetical protein
MTTATTNTSGADIKIGDGKTEVSAPGGGTAELSTNTGGGGGFGAVPEGFDPSRDLDLPRIILVHGTSEICDEVLEGGKAKAGSHILGQDSLLIDDDGSVAITVCAMDFFYEENLDQDERAERFPERYRNTAEVAAAGLTTKWQDDTRPGAIPVLDLVVAVERPETGADHIAWMPCADGKDRLVCRMTLRKGSYRFGGKTVWTAAHGALRKAGYPTGRFKLEHHKYTAGSNKVSASKLTLLAERNTPEAVAAIKELMGE